MNISSVGPSVTPIQPVSAPPVQDRPNDGDADDAAPAKAASPAAPPGQGVKVDIRV